MSYQLTLEKAGAKVLDTFYAGSYQGTWGSIVEFNGKKGLVTGAYGSCPHCDAFQSEFNWGFDYSYDPETGKHYCSWDQSPENEITEEEYNKAVESYDKKLADFGISYLHVIQDAWDIQNQLNHISKDEDDWYDHEMRQLLEWALPILKENE